MKKLLRNRNLELLRILGLDNTYDNIDAVIEKVTYLKEENRRLEGIVNNLEEESRFGIFQKLANSSSYYTKNKELVEAAFKEVTSRDKLALMSADIIHNARNEQNIHKSITDRFRRMGLSYVLINGFSGRNIYIIGFNNRIMIENIIKLFGFTAEQLSNDGYKVLISFSREINELSEVFEAYKDIKICRDYRCVGDTESILTTEKITVNKSLCMPMNFTDELKSYILESDEEKIREYIKNLFDININNKIPVIKFEHLLRIMQNTYADAMSVVQKNPETQYELEQFFIWIIENFKDTLDVESLVNSYVNILRFGVKIDKSKKSVLNRTDIMKYINSHYNEDLYLEKMASEFKTTPKYFSNYFKREFSVGFSEYLSNIRISHAKRILSETELHLNEVGEKVGYPNPVTFAVAFKKRVGMPPGKFRELNKL